MPRGRSHSAGTNCSGAKRKRVMSKSNTADEPEAGSNLGERPLGEQQTGSSDQLLSDKDMGSEENSSIVIEDGGGENNGKEVDHLSPTNFDTAWMVTASA